MFHQIKVTAFALVLLSVLSAARHAVAAEPTIPMKGFGVGQVIEQQLPTADAAGFQIWVAEGVGNLYGHVTVVGMTLFTADGRVIAGSGFVATTDDGSPA